MERVYKLPQFVIGALVFGVLTAATVADAHLAPPVPGAFTITPTQTLLSFQQQVSSSGLVRERYAEVYHINPSQVPGKFRGITVGLLPHSEAFKEYFVAIGGSIKSHHKTYPAGTYVAFSADGQPILHWRCGNPLTPLYPTQAIKKVSKRVIITMAPPAAVPVVVAPNPAPVAVIPPPPPPAVVLPAPVVVAPAPVSAPAPVVVAPAPVNAASPTPAKVRLRPWSIMGGILETQNAYARNDSHQILYVAGVDYAFLQPTTFLGLQPSVYGDFHGVARGYVDTYAGGLALRTVSNSRDWSPYVGVGVGLYGSAVTGQSTGHRYVDRLGGKVFAGVDTPYGFFLQAFYDAAGNIRKAQTGGPGVEVGIRF